MWPSLVKFQYTELKLSCGNDPVVKNSIYSNGDLDFLLAFNIECFDIFELFVFVMETKSSRKSKRSMLNSNFKTLKDYLMFHEAWWD
jgi:hypothetical protein